MMRAETPRPIIAATVRVCRAASLSVLASTVASPAVDRTICTDGEFKSGLRRSLMTSPTCEKRRSAAARL